MTNANKGSFSDLATEISGLEFTQQVVVLDYHFYKKCSFTECNLIYHGHGPVGLGNCRFINCNWTFSGPAASTLHFMAVMYQQGDDARGLIESTFENIRRGEPYAF